MTRRKNLKALEEADLEVINERARGRSALNKERWRGHSETHKDLATNLAAYKTESNEWRSTLSDLRLTFLSKTEFDAEHRALKADLLGDLRSTTVLVDAHALRIATLETARATREATDLALANQTAELRRRDDSNRARAQWTIGIAVAVTSIVVSAMVTIVIRLLTG
jgi:hypothetical protein